VPVTGSLRLSRCLTRWKGAMISLSNASGSEYSFFCYYTGYPLRCGYSLGTIPKLTSTNVSDVKVDHADSDAASAPALSTCQ
jgi:hypothetical protein